MTTDLPKRGQHRVEQPTTLSSGSASSSTGQSSAQAQATLHPVGVSARYMRNIALVTATVSITEYLKFRHSVQQQSRVFRGRYKKLQWTQSPYLWAGIPSSSFNEAANAPAVVKLWFYSPSISVLLFSSMLVSFIRSNRSLSLYCSMTNSNSEGWSCCKLQRSFSNEWSNNNSWLLEISAVP